MRPHSEFKQAQTTVEFLLGPVKIKDGLFMGDEISARDLEFIMSNKVTHIVNTVSKAVPNLFEKYGVQYLSVHWTEKEENIFDKKNNAVNAIFNFVEEAFEAGESCLIHSVNGKSRAFSVLTAYLMRKYSWSLAKCVQFVRGKKENLEIRNNFHLQLQELEKRLQQLGKLSTSWLEIKNEEDLVLTNTFYNSRKNSAKEDYVAKRSNAKRVAWAEKIVVSPKPPQMSLTMTRFRDTVEKKPIPSFKSILKGDLGEEETQDKFSSTMKQDSFINSINGNIVHVTVNNFITTDKKPEPQRGFNSRPYSSDNKERKEPMRQTPTRKNPLYENPIMTLKNPYQMRTNKLGPKLPKRKEQIKNPVMAYERPQSANMNVGRRGNLRVVAPAPLVEKQEMMVTGMNRKRYPSANPRDDSYKWK